MKLRTRTLLLVMLAVFLGPVQAGDVKVQKWVDSAGRVHFGDQPPHTVDAEEMVINTGGAAEQDPVAGAKPKQPVEDSEACKQARKQLNDYERAPFLYETDADGKKHILPDEERQQLLEGVKGRVDAEC
jgi:hypothetical protein